VLLIRRDGNVFIGLGAADGITPHVQAPQLRIG
jgi:hypothetical protein